MITGTQDVDVKIFESFDLEDLRKICQVDPSINYLCKTHINLQNRMKNAIKKAEYIISLINNRVSGIILQPYHETEDFESFHQLMKSCHISEPPNEDDDTDLHPSDIFNDFTVFNFNIYKSGLRYTLFYQLGHLGLYGDQSSIDVTSFYGTEHELKEFLLHLYYNNLVL